MSEEKSSPVGLIVGVAVVAVVIGIMIGKSGSNTESVSEVPSPANQGDNSVNEQDSKPVEGELKIGENIEAKIREAINKPEGELTKADLEKVTDLNLENNQLTSVVTIVCCTRAHRPGAA